MITVIGIHPPFEQKVRNIVSLKETLVIVLNTQRCMKFSYLISHISYLFSDENKRIR